jgi:hypothetical protein
MLKSVINNVILKFLINHYETIHNIQANLGNFRFS